MWFDFFIDKDISDKIKIRNEIKSNNLEIEKLETLYTSDCKQHFIKWFIPKLNKFIENNYDGYSVKIDKNFLKKMQ